MPESSPTFSPPPRTPAEGMSRYRDALLRDAAPAELAHLGSALDPEEGAWLGLFRAAQREPISLDPTFLARLDQVVPAAPGPHPAEAEPPGPEGLCLTRS